MLSQPEETPGSEIPEITNAQFERIVSLIRSVSGIVIEPTKKQMVYARLSRRLRARSMTDFDAYLAIVESGNDAAEVQAFINAVTTNLTSFFRESHHFDHLREHVLAPYISGGARRMRIWSAGCSTGEEPYTIAMTVLSQTQAPPTDLKVLATDIDTSVLQKSASGVYPDNKLSSIPAPLQAYVNHDKSKEEISFVEATKRLITFKRLNLMARWPVSGPFDAIFCRNVLIYFDAETKAKVISNFADLLCEDGFLYLGHSESILGNHPKLTSLGRTIYQRKR